MKDFNLHKYLRENPLTKQTKTLSKGKINEAFEGFGGVRGIGAIGDGVRKDPKNSNFDPTDSADYDEQSRPNQWISDIDRMPEYNGWKASWDHPGIITWTNADVPDAMVVATPGWDGHGTPVEFQSGGGSSQMLKVLDQDVFPTFKDYLKAVKPYLDMVLDANVNPTSTDYEKSPIKAPGMGEFQGLHEEGSEEKMKEGLAGMKTLFVLDYGSGTVYDKLIPADMQSEEIEEMLTDEYGMNPDNIYYMITDKSQVEDLDGGDDSINETMTASKGWEYDDEDFPDEGYSANDRMEGLVNQRELAAFGEAVMNIAQDLDDEGFDAEDIKAFLIGKLKDMIIA